MKVWLQEPSLQFLSAAQRPLPPLRTAGKLSFRSRQRRSATFILLGATLMSQGQNIIRRFGAKDRNAFAASQTVGLISL
jgi:hypothetical protein